MNHAASGDLYSVIWLVRGLAQRMLNTSETIHRMLGITAGKRNVIELLAHRELRSVPEIAREQSVSRQNVQIIVNDLIAEGLVDTQPNPAHKRSPLLYLTGHGKKLIGDIRTLEAKVITDMATQFNTSELKASARTLQGMVDYFATTTALETECENDQQEKTS